MGSASVVFSLIAVALVFLGLWIGFVQGRRSSQGLQEQKLESEKKLAETREVALAKQLEDAKVEIAALKPKAEELTRVQEQLRNEEAKYAQMKADLDSAFKGAAADALRANTESFLDLAKQKLGAQAQEAQQTLDAKERAIKNLLDPLDKTLKSLDEQARAMENARTGAYSEIRSWWRIFKTPFQAHSILCEAKPRSSSEHCGHPRRVATGASFNFGAAWNMQV